MGTTRVTDGADIGGVTISNANKVWWPDDGITKGDIARFYYAISPLLLPWMRDRPLTAERCPDGMLGGCFYRKNFPVGNIPAAAPRLTLRAESTGKDVNYLVGGTLEALLGLVRLGCISVHVMNSRVGSMRDADWLAFDLDPSSGEFSGSSPPGRTPSTRNFGSSRAPLRKEPTVCRADCISSSTPCCTASRSAFSSRSISSSASERRSTLMEARCGMEFTEVPPSICPTLNVVRGSSGTRTLTNRATARASA